MYTVVITAKKTSDNMQEHYPVLKNILESGNIGLCQWIKQGTTLETALPELYGLINKNKEWRAIVVMYDESDGIMDRTNNPYDYANPNLTGDLTDYDKPLVSYSLEESNERDLIRLTHLLAGVPLPTPEYELADYPKNDPNQNEDEEVYSIPYTVYEQVRKEEYEIKTQEYNQWNSEHKMKEIMPSELILIRTRDITNLNDTEIIKQAWENHNESESSEFWKRNLYPQNTRFLVYDIEKRGMMYEERDALRFWLAVMTLSVNSIDSNVLQPHKLYSLKVKLDNEKLRSVFQNKIKGLNLAKQLLIKDFEKNDSRIINKDEVPDFFMPVNVTFRNVNFVRSNRYSGFKVDFFGGITNDEEKIWNAYAVDTFSRANQLIKQADRELEYIALSFRNHCEYADSEVKLIDRYAEEDLCNDIKDTYAKILDTQKKLPKGTLVYDEEMKLADEKVKQDIFERMSPKQALVTIILALVTMVLMLLPAFRQASSQKETILLCFCAIVCISGGAFLTIFLQKRKFEKHVKMFQNYFNLMSSEMDQNAKLYAEFLSNIASHIKGSSYLRIMKTKKMESEKALGIKKEQIGLIDEFKSRLTLWSSAMRISINLDALDETEMMLRNSSIDFDLLYSINSEDTDRRIPLNQSGMYIKTPFNFVDALVIEREEIYDNV